MAGVIDWLRQERAAPMVELAGKPIPIAIIRNSRARRLTMRLAPDGSEVRITAPSWCPTGQALAFANARHDWLAHQLARVPDPVDLRVRGTVRYRGRELAITWDARAPRRPQVDAERVVLGGPAETLLPRLRRWLEGEAMRVMAGDLAEFCAKAHVPAPELRLTRAGRRWGSCSSANVVRINWRLIMAPDFVRRSVVAHEVAHLLHFDHSPAFHAALRSLYPGGTATADAWLRTEGRALYAEFG